MTVKVGDRFVERRIGMTMTSRLGQIETLYEVEELLKATVSGTPILCKEVGRPYKALFNAEDVEQMVQEFQENLERGKLINKDAVNQTA